MITMKQKIKNTPTGYRDYYKSFKDNISKKIAECNKIFKEKYDEAEQVYNAVKNGIEVYNNLGITLDAYDEFVNNEYNNGVFYCATKNWCMKHQDNYEELAPLLTLYKLAKLQADIHIINIKLDKYNKIMELSCNDYNKIVKTFYYKVQELMILKGYGYSFEGELGWTCINRCKLGKIKPHIDYKATKENKKRLIEAGERIMRKEEKIWCEENGIEYNAVDYRVYQNIEYVYEVPLIHCTLPGGHDIKLKLNDYRAISVRGKTNEDLLKECNNDVNKILQLPVDFRTRLNLCLEADKGLYLNYIRNESQKTITAGKANR